MLTSISLWSQQIACNVDHNFMNTVKKYENVTKMAISYKGDVLLKFKKM